VESCPRAKKGFPRKRNRDVHMNTHHNASSTIIGATIREGGTSETPEQARNEILGTQLSGGEAGEMIATEDMSGLYLKLKELEREKRGLDFRRSRVDEDIKALKRTIELVAT
jgi:hypothetical protein